MAGFESLAYCSGTTKYRNDASKSIAAEPRRRSLNETAPPPPSARSHERARRNDRHARTVKAGLTTVGVAGALRLVIRTPLGLPSTVHLDEGSASHQRRLRRQSSLFLSETAHSPADVAREIVDRLFASFLDDGADPRCFLPDLTRFERSQCAGPDRQRHVSMTRAHDRRPRTAFGPAGADFGFREPLTPHVKRPGVAPVRA